MKPINEDEAEILIEEHLRERGWNITDLTVTRKRWRDHLEGEEADRVFLHDGKVMAILEAKKPEVLINRLLELEEEIKTDLHELLVLMTDTEQMEAQP